MIARITGDGGCSALLLVSLVLAACGGGQPKTGPAGPSRPIPTARGTAAGAPMTATITSAGGSLSSADGVLTVTLPAGALAADTAITIQAITAEFAGGVGSAYRLTPDGLTFSAPVQLSFGYADADLSGSAAGLLDLAVQDAGGYWQPVSGASVDEPGRRITATTSHFSDYSRVLGLQLDPPEKTIRVNESVALTARYCHPESFPDAPDLAPLVYHCDDTLAPLNALRDWSVNGTPGGGGAQGTVMSTGNLSATYRAPATVAATSVAAVSVTTTVGGSTEILVSNITVLGSATGWSGTSTHTGVAGTSTAQVTWEVTDELDGFITLAPVGTVWVTVATMDGCVTSLDPSTVPITHDHGELTIDTTTTPMTFTAAGNTFFQPTLTAVCPTGTTSGPTFWAGTWLSAFGDVSADGRTIAGTATDGSGTSVFSFTRD